MTCEIPVPGPATAKDWKHAEVGTTRYPGKNHPGLGAWLHKTFCPPNGKCADPMIGAGGLWLEVPLPNELYGCDVNEEALMLADQNAWPCRADEGNAETWRPPCEVDFVMFSPPYPQSHTSGATEHQKQIRESKNLHAMQGFKCEPPDMLKVYKQVRSYCAGPMCVIVRNRIVKGVENDWVGLQTELVRSAGWELVDLLWRDLVRPTGFQQWKLSRDPNTPWIKREWVIVAR